MLKKKSKKFYVSTRMISLERRHRRSENKKIKSRRIVRHWPPPVIPPSPITCERPSRYRTDPSPHSPHPSNTPSLETAVGLRAFFGADDEASSLETAVGLRPSSEPTTNQGKGHQAKSRRGRRATVPNWSPELRLGTDRRRAYSPKKRI